MNTELLLQLFLPLFAAVGLYLFPRNKDQTKMGALIFAITYLANSFMLLKNLPSLDSLQILYKINFPEFFGLGYTLGVDGLSGTLILLNAFLLVIVILATWNFESKNHNLYYFCIFSLSWAVNGSLMAVNLFSFYLFWEIMLIPLFLLVGVFGGKNRIYASVKFFIYTAVGSILMLGAIFYMSSLSYTLSDSYDLTPEIIRNLPLAFDGFWSAQSLVFWAFCIAFFIKVPVFPFHSWLPDAHVEAPTAGSIILAGVLLKLGIYGLLRFVIPLFPEAVESYRLIIIWLGVIGVIYGALTALAQTDVKKVVAFSSISHMGYIVAGIFALNEMAVNGAVFQMVSHGLTTGGLFIAVHCLYVRRQTKDIAQFGGVAKVMPLFAFSFFLMILGSMAVPLTNGFVGEFLIIFGVYKVDFLMGLLSCVGVILGPVYLLTLFQKTMLGKITIKENMALKDITLFEFVPFALLGILILFYGVYPKALMSLFKGPVNLMLGL